MLKAKKTKTKPVKQYAIIFSECGDISQGSTYDGRFYSSVQEAKNNVSAAAELFESNIGAPQSAWIVQVMALGKPSGYSWDK